MKTWFAIPLWQRVIGALVLGVIVGLIWGPGAESIKFIGDIFIKSIKMLVVPLIFFSLVAGVCAIGDLRKLGAVGGRSLLLFLATGAASVALGLALGTFLMPGAGLSIPLPDTFTPSTETLDWREMLLRFVPENIIETMAGGDVLPLITFAILFGMGILLAGKEGAPMIRAMDAGAVAMQKMTMLVMELTPFGVFALIAWVAGSYGTDALLPLAKVVGLNYFGCALIIFAVYPIIIKAFTRLPIVDFFRGILDAMAVAYSTASSNATLPVTMRCAQRNLGVSRSVSRLRPVLGGDGQHERHRHVYGPRQPVRRAGVRHRPVDERLYHDRHHRDARRGRRGGRAGLGPHHDGPRLRGGRHSPGDHRARRRHRPHHGHDAHHDEHHRRCDGGRRGRPHGRRDRRRGI